MLRDEADLEQWLAFAKKLAFQAGEMLKEERQRANFDRQYKQGEELVTSADMALDDWLCDSIRETFPAHKILSEESSPDFCFDNLSTSDVVWVIDPIDGTVNFAHEHKHVAISIGLFQAGRRVGGVVNAPFLQELYWAGLGMGAYCNDKPIQVSRAEKLSRALVATGFPYQKDDLDTLLRRVKQILSHCQDVRRAGSAALDLCWVASAKLDAYYESVKPWDMAAGALIAEEAGATVGYFLEPSQSLPEALRSEYLLVATPDLYQDLAALLAEA